LQSGMGGCKTMAWGRSVVSGGTNRVKKKKWSNLRSGKVDPFKLQNKVAPRTRNLSGEGF